MTLIPRRNVRAGRAYAAVRPRAVGRALAAILLGGFALGLAAPRVSAQTPSDADAALDAALLRILSQNRPASETLVRGTVVDRTTGAGVAGASVLFEQGDLRHSTRTDAEGTFTLAAIRSGAYRMTVEHLAYQTATSEVEVVGGGVVTHIRVELDREIIALGAIEVTVDQRPTFGALLPVYERMEYQRSLGMGRFFDRREIEESSVSRITDMLSRVAGVRVNGDQAVLNSLNPGCGTPVFYIDGAKVSISWSDLRTMVPISNIEIMEVYRRPSEIPGEFSGSDAECGVIAIWTRRG